MPSAVLTTLVLAQLISPARRAELAAAAAASPRPDVCMVAGSGRGTQRQTFWDRARRPGLAGYCSALARGFGKLRTDPAAALEAAKVARRALGKRAAPVLVLEGRALLALGRSGAALEALSQARQLDRRSLDAPDTLHAYARAAASSDLGSAAQEAYRRLVPQAMLLPDVQQRQLVYVEAAVWAMDGGADGLNQAIGYLTEARRQGASPGYQPFVVAALALALELSGQTDQARGVAAEVGGAAGLLRQAPAFEGEGTESNPSQTPPAAAVTLPIIPRPVLHAMVAVLAEGEDRVLADERWQEALRLVSDPAATFGKTLKPRFEEVVAARQRGRGR